MLRTLLCLYLSAFVCCLSHAQQPDESKQKLQIGLFFQVNSILDDENIATGDYIGYAIKDHKSNYTVTVDFEYAITNKISILSGLNYTYRKLTAQWYCAVCDWIGPWPEPERFTQQFLALPLAGRYYFLNGKIQLFGEAGAINQLGLTEELDERKYLLKGHLASGVGYRIWKNLLVELSANYQPAFGKLYSDSDYKYRILGFKLGLKKSF